MPKLRQKSAETSSAAPQITTTVTMPQQPPPAPPEPAERSSRPDIFSYMKALSEKEWADTIVYVYREQPKANIVGAGGYLDKMIVAFDVDDMKQRWGGGVFNLKLLHRNSLVYDVNVKIEGQPKYDPQREIAPGGVAANGGAGNAEVMNLLRELVGDLRQRESTGNDPATAAAIGMMSKAAERAMEIVKGQTPAAESPATSIREMVLALKEMGIIGQPQGLGAVIEQLKPWLPMLTPLIARLFTPVDPVAQFESIGKMIAAIDAIRGEGGGGGAKDWKAALAQGALENLPRVLDTIQQRQAAANPPAAQPARVVYAQPQQRPAGPTAPPAAQPAGPTQPPTATGFRTVPLNADAGAPAMSGAPPNPVPGPVAGGTPTRAELRNSWIKDKIVEMVFVGFSGEEIIDTMYQWDDTLVRDIAGYSPEMVEAFFASDPVLRRCLENPDWKDILAEAMEAAREIVADENGALKPEPSPVN